MFLMRFLRYLICFFILLGALSFTQVFAEGEEPIVHEIDSNRPFMQINRHRRGPSPALNESDDFNFFAGGYFQGDLFDFYNAEPLKGQGNIRAARLSLGFDYKKKYQFYTSYDFATGQLYNVVFTYDNQKNFLISTGQFSPIFGFENNTSTPFVTMMELPLPLIAFSPPYTPGVEAGYYNSPFVVYAGVFTPKVGSTVRGRTPFSAQATVAFSPVHTDTRVAHLSISGWHQGMDGQHMFSDCPEPEFFAGNSGNLIGINSIFNVSSYDVLDSAAAAVYGPFSIQSEYVYSWVNRSLSLPSPQFSGYYITTSYFLTGESRLYNFKFASFAGITPIKGSHGAWQVALQFSSLNLTDRGVNGGREQNISAGLNWYPITHIEVLLDYIHAMATPNSSGFNQTANMYGLRLQFVY